MKEVAGSDAGASTSQSAYQQGVPALRNSQCSSEGGDGFSAGLFPRPAYTGLPTVGPPGAQFIYVQTLDRD